MQVFGLSSSGCAHIRAPVIHIKSPGCTQDVRTLIHNLGELLAEYV